MAWHGEKVRFWFPVTLLGGGLAVLAVRLADGESLRGACAAANAAAAKSVERKYVLPSLPLRGEIAV